MPSLRDLLNALGQKELQILTDALGIPVKERRRKEAYADAIVQSRRISSANLMEALSVKTLKHLCEVFGCSATGRSRQDFIKALMAPAKDKGVASTAKKAKKSAGEQTAPKVKIAKKEAADPSKQPGEPKEAPRARGALRAKKVVPAAAAKNPPTNGAKKQNPPAEASFKPLRAAAKKSSSSPVQATPSDSSANAAPPHPQATTDSPRSPKGTSGTDEPEKQAESSSKPSRAAGSASKERVKGSGKSAAKKRGATRRGAAPAEDASEERGGTPPRPAISAPLIGVPRARSMPQQATSPEASADHAPASPSAPAEAPPPAATSAAAPSLPEPPQPPAAVRRGLVSWAEAASAAERRGQSAESMLGAPASEAVHDVHQRCPKCKKRVEMNICQSQQCQNRFVAAPGRRICAECLFERHNLSITDFNARLAEARQCPHCSKPLPERAAG